MSELTAQETFERILKDYREFAALIGLESIVAIPLSALRGDNITEPSAKMPWYHGPTLMGHLETVPLGDHSRSAPFRASVCSGTTEPRRRTTSSAA